MDVGFRGVFQHDSGTGWRKRALVGGAAVAAVVAIGALTWMLLMPGSNDEPAPDALALDGRPDEATPSPSPSVTRTADSAPTTSPSPSARPSVSPSSGTGGEDAEDASGSPGEADDAGGSGAASGGSGEAGGSSGSGGAGSGSGSGSGSGAAQGPASFAPSDQASSGATFYVDPGAGAGGDGSASAPYASLDALFDDGLIESRNWTSFPANGNGTLQVRNPGAPIGPGDTIVLAGGTYDDLWIRGYYNASPVTIKAAKGQRPVFDFVSVTASAGWVIDGIEVRGGIADESDMVSVTGHNHFGPTTGITIRNTLVHTVPDASGWSANDWLSRVKNGIAVRTDGVTVTGNTVRNTKYAIAVWGDDHRVQGNTIDFFSGDGIRSVGTDDSQFIGNRISNSIKVDDHHDDGFQHFPSYDATDKPTRNVVVRDNVVINCEGVNRLCGTLQGIVSFDGTLENWTVENNTVITNHWHGLSLYGIHDSVVRGNVVRDPDTVGDVGPTWLRINTAKSGAKSTNVLVECNVVASIVSSEENTGITIRKNTLSNSKGATKPAGC